MFEGDVMKSVDTRRTDVTEQDQAKCPDPAPRRSDYENEIRRKLFQKRERLHQELAAINWAIESVTDDANVQKVLRVISIAG